MLSFRIFWFLNNNNLKEISKLETIDHTDIIDEFPILSEDGIARNVTLGTEFCLRRRSICISFPVFLSDTYQLKFARSCAEEMPELLKKKVLYEA